MILAEKIALLRRKNGWSQEELANQLAVSRQAVSKWESGASIPDLDKILKLSELFQVTTDYLLKDALEQPDAAAAVQPEELDREPHRTVSLDEANEYLDTVQELRGRMAAGVGLCILSPVCLLQLGAWADGTPNEDRMGGLGLIILLVVVALGLLCILPAAFRLEKFEYLEKEEIDLAYGVAGIVQRRQQDYAQTYRRSMTQGVVLCVLAVVPLFGAAMLNAPDFWGGGRRQSAAGHRGGGSAALRPGRDDAGQLRQAASDGRIFCLRKVDEPPRGLVRRGLLVSGDGGVSRCQLPL